MKKDIVLSILGIILILAFLAVLPMTRDAFEKTWNQFAATLFVQSVTVEDLKIKSKDALQFDDTSINILIVPGHEKETGGTAFGDLREYDVNIELSKYLHEYLEESELYDSFLAQDENGWHPVLAEYFQEEREDILEFKNEKQAIMGTAVQLGLIDNYRGVGHNFAPTETTIYLYGINKWASENEIDIIIHVHFNDYAERQYGTRGEHMGLAVYVPEDQFSNAIASKEVGEHIFNTLNTRFPRSTLPIESAGVVEDQELIAIGANNSLDPASVLIEYSYIYEPHVTDDEIRPISLKEMAYLTYHGLQSFFDTSIDEVEPETTYTFTSDMEYGARTDLDTYHLQKVLLKEEMYPPTGRTMHDCPITGNFFSCTETAVKQFQSRHGINTTGYVGPETRKTLNTLVH
ncbi:MAG: peptidoglycan-binding domain-containing protein [Candidatus Paceibacterota bacterium]